MIAALAKKIFGTKNDRLIKQYLKKVEIINSLEEKYQKLSDDELKKAFNDFREQVLESKVSKDEILYDVFAITREASKRSLNKRHYDVQLIGGMVLNDGMIAEMKTGEGKTLVATLAVVLNAMDKKGVHVVTVNDYLAKRDATEMGALYNFLGLSVGVIVGGEYDDVARKAAYNCDITYGTNNEFGFDYLRDNMKFDIDEKVQRGHNFVIVDEVDSILIDEARTPLIISGPTERTLDGYVKANEIAKKLVRGKAPETPEEKPSGDFVVDEKNRNIFLTEAGIEKAEKLFGVENLYDLNNAVLSHYLDQALKANNLFEKDVHYVIRDNQVIIVDEFTGRLSEGRRFSEGLHQALEAKEGVTIQEESQTLADITFQNYFRLYKKIAGMTGTAQTEATEFAQIYNLDVISIPTNLPVARIDKNDLIYKSEKEKFDSVIKEIKRLHAKGQPVLVGTASIEKSEQLHKLLLKEKIPHSVLNAKNHEKEAEIIALAGKKGAVTIATNMAGRGVDIKIDEDVKNLGGLYILGTERHESRRIDNQLRGRAGRQGDPGESRFFLSLEDNLLRIFGSDRIKGVMSRLGLKEGESIESRLVTRAVEGAQKKVENLHFESRKHILEYDDVANEQRKMIYKYRDELLSKDYDLEEKIEENRKVYVEYLLNSCGIYTNIEEDNTQEENDILNLSSLILKEIGEEISVDKLKENFSRIDKFLEDELKLRYEKRLEAISKEQRISLEKMVYLQVLDRDWREHLYQMDTLKTGIGLRGYNQKDPLIEYKKESYDLFVELVKALKIDSIRALQALRFNFEPTQEEELKEQPKKSKKVSKNEPCPCGSGKKYKNCHGKSGPKKGKFAKVD